MSPNNQNEYGIIDATPSTSVSNDSTRYPYANEPTNALQNMNYKDYLRMSEGYDNKYFANPEVFAAPGGITTGITIVTKLLGWLGLPFAGETGMALNFILGLLWPTSGNPWAELMILVEELINQKIEEAVRNKALADLANSGRALQSYLNAFEDWQKNPNIFRSKELVRERFANAEHSLRTEMSSFAIRGFEIPLLATYAQAANLHLFLIKDVQIYGKEWGYTQADIDLFYREQVEFTKEYTEHCINIYNDGLNQLKGSNAKQWIAFNRFRREMTLTVLDVVALFPNYDVRMYPIKTTTELTRTIYTDPLGYTKTGSSSTPPWYNYGSSFSYIESVAIPAPSLVKWLSQIEIYSKSARATPQSADYWAGHTITYHYSGNNDQVVANYGDRTNPVIVNRYNFEQADIYRVSSSVASSTTSGVKLLTTKAIFDGISTNNGLVSYMYEKLSNFFNELKDTITELPVQVSSSPTYGDAEQYSHRLSYVSNAPTEYSSGGHLILGLIPVLGWTHTSLTQTNQIHSDSITQIPAVKANSVSSYVTVEKGTGFTGGDLVKFSTGFMSTGIQFNLKIEERKRYRIRIRYAADVNARLSANHFGTTFINIKSTMSQDTPLKYNDFQYAETDGTLTLQDSHFSLFLEDSDQSGKSIYIDRIEFIPVDETYEAEQDLENAKKAVNALFTNTKDGLRPGVTDYEVNQAANLVECLSDDLYPNEKRLLFDAVREAKRLSEARNLLQDPDFQEINGENGWTASTGIEVVEGDALFKGRYLRLPGARQIDTETYPTYLYQKIDEGVLKPYTRYRLRGFVGRSQGLEIYTIRHQTNRIVKNVPDNLLPDASPGNAGDGINRCSEQKYVNSRLEGEKGLPNGSRSAEAHEFSIPIDTGEIDYNENAGIWIGFKITDPEGYATLGNLELVEEGPLSGDALERLQREEQQWKIQMTKRREETDRKYMIAKQAVDRLYADYQDQQLNPNVEITDITAAQNVIQSIPYVYNDAFPGLPGMNYTKFTELTDRLQQAWSLYDQRNAIPNGDFRNELSNWNTTAGVNVQQLNGTSVLVIPNWDAQVSQQFTVQPNQRYVLRVTARKEGVGNGYVSIRDGGNQTETLTFSASDYDTNGVYNIQASNTNGYNTNGVYNDQTGYITKTAEFIQHTNQVWIEMSETEGTFYIESVELIVDVE
uniref:Crystaline entomocidal protoxin n=1 Tax=Bacillus thuringiensis TaxID=1428 RepID=R4TH85_BACTU|nr:cry protein [Bacillus thuringiensis]